MSSQNYFDLLGDDENDEPTAVIARATLPSFVERPATKRLNPARAPSAATLTKSPPQPPETGAKESRSSDSGRGGRGAPRGGRGSRVSHGERDRDGLSLELVSLREGREGSSRDRGSHGDRHVSTNRENIDGMPGVRGGSHGLGFGDGAFSLEHGPGFGLDKTFRADGEGRPVDGNRGRGRSGNRGRERVSGESDERPRRREFDRRSGSHFGSEVKRDGSGRGNWGAEADPNSHLSAVEDSPKEMDKSVVEADAKGIESNGPTLGGPSAENSLEKEDEDNELTLDEYEKILEEKRKALSSIKSEERKVLADKAFESMQLVEKRNNEDVFIKVGLEKEKKKKDHQREKEALEKEERARKTQSINEFLKPTDGEKFHSSPGGGGRGRGRHRSGESRGTDGDRPGGLGTRGNYGAGMSNSRRVSAPRIEDPGQFPTLGGK